VKKFSLSILIIINVAIVLGLWLSGWCGFMNPNTYGWLSLIGYAFPAFLLAAIAFLFVWIIIKKRFILISFIGLLVAYHPVTLYFPINKATASNELPDSLITLLSYNTCSWGNMPTAPNKDLSNEEKNEILLDFFKTQNADIVALQEAYKNDKVKAIYDLYEYSDTARGKDGGVTMTLLSRYPIKNKELIYIESKGNAVAAFWLDVKGREVIIINVHLETMHFTLNERTKFREIVHGNQKEKDSIRSTSHTIFGKIYSATKIRAYQADAVAEFISKHSDTPIIIMGDFNDIPQSYVHDKICGDMTDCYAASGFGPGYTFSHYAMRARIDNIICTRDFTPYNCKVLDNISLSDHLPVTCKVLC
jgi:endonuclease/exonuclease/phosphatase family metal-dependent hydrolase